MIRALTFFIGIPLAVFFAMLISLAVGSGLDNMFVADGDPSEGIVGGFIGAGFFISCCIGIIMGAVALEEDVF